MNQSTDKEIIERWLANVKNRGSYLKCCLPSNSDDKAYKAAEMFGLAAEFGENATLCGLTGWKQGEATKLAKKCFKAWLDLQTSSEPNHANTDVKTTYTESQHAQTNESLKIIAESLDYLAATKPDKEV